MDTPIDAVLKIIFPRNIEKALEDLFFEAIHKKASCTIIPVQPHTKVYFHSQEHVGSVGNLCYRCLFGDDAQAARVRGCRFNYDIGTFRFNE